MATSEGSSSPPLSIKHHTLNPPLSARNSPRMTRKHHQVSVSLATTPTQINTTIDFGSDNSNNCGSRGTGLDRVILERNLERLLQEKSTHPEETPTELGRYYPFFIFDYYYDFFFFD